MIDLSGFKKVVRQYSNHKISGKSYMEFYQDVLNEMERIKKRTPVFIDANTKYEQAVQTIAVLLKDAVAIPLCANYGQGRNKQIKKQVENKKFNRNVSAILFTSGSSGIPKGIMLSKKALENNIRAIEGYMGNKERNLLIFRPIVHSAVFTGELLYGIFHGWNISFYDADYNPIKLYRQMKEENITLIGMTPTLLKTFLRLGIIFKNIEVIISGEILYKKDAINFAQKMPDCYLYNVYGLTENSPRVAALTPNEFSKYPGSVGKAIQNTRIKIYDGEIFVKSKSIMLGYFNNRPQTQAVKRFGWLKTGDLGQIDSFGNLTVLGRKDNMIIRNGVNIYPEEIEQVISACNNVDECVVYGRKDERFGQIIIVDFVGKCTDKEVSDFAIKNLPAYLVPNEYNKKEKLNKTISGKIRRKVK